MFHTFDVLYWCLALMSHISWIDDRMPELDCVFFETEILVWKLNFGNSKLKILVVSTAVASLLRVLRFSVSLASQFGLSDYETLFNALCSICSICSICRIEPLSGLHRVVSYDLLSHNLAVCRQYPTRRWCSLSFRVDWSQRATE